jgi:hypothetical protein
MNANEKARVQGRIGRWRAKAEQVDVKIKRDTHRFSDRALGEGQGYVRALRECAEDLSRTLKDCKE